MEAVAEEAGEVEFVEEGSSQILDALVLEADMMEVEMPSPPKGPNLHPFFQPRVSSSGYLMKLPLLISSRCSSLWAHFKPRAPIPNVCSRAISVDSATPISRMPKKI